MSAPPARTGLADTYPNPSNATFRTAIGALWDTLFASSGGLLGTTGNAVDARSALGIGSAITYRNKLINGNFQINQRVVSGTVTLLAGVYGHDRWKAGASGCTYTFATSGLDTTLTITAGSLIQTVEAANVEGGNYIMTWTGTAQGKIGGGTAAASGVTATGVTAAANLSVEFGTGTLSKVQLESGTSATPWERRMYPAELALAMRYFQTSYDSVAPGTASAPANRLVTLGQSATTPGLQFVVRLPVRMRTTPTITLYNPTTGASGSCRNESVGSDLTLLTFGTPGVDFFAAYNNAAAAAVASIYGLHYTAAAEL